MAKLDPTLLDARHIAALTRSGELTAVAVAEAFLARISERDEAVRAWAWLEPEAVLDAAQQIDARPERGLLHGVPVGIKDVIQTADMPTQQGSPLHAARRGGIDAACVASLRAAGALILGKTATVEFAAFGQRPETRNPIDPARSPGGTSAGSAAAVADRQVPLALGTQTAGSTIRPASFCGVHAFKPTWGLVSREGARQFSVSLDTVTWFGRSLDDLDLVSDAFALGDGRAEPPALEAMTVAVCRTPAWPLTTPAVRATLDGVAAALARAGVRVIELELPPSFGGLRASALAVMMGEGRAAFLAELQASRAQLHPDYIAMIEGARRVSDAQMIAGLDHGAAARAQFDALAAGFDAVLAPSAAGEGPPGLDSTGDPAINILWTMLHAPCVNLPVGRGPAGLPIGVSVVGPRGSDRDVLASARQIERACLSAPNGSR